MAKGEKKISGKIGSRESMKDRQFNGQKKMDKQLSTKYYTEI